MTSSINPSNDVTIVIKELQVKIDLLEQAVEKLQESNDGNLRQKGNKERISVLEYNVEANRKAWQSITGRMSEFEKMFILKMTASFDLLRTDVTRNRMQIVINSLAIIFIFLVCVLFGLFLAGRFSIVLR